MTLRRRTDVAATTAQIAALLGGLRERAPSRCRARGRQGAPALVALAASRDRRQSTQRSPRAQGDRGRGRGGKINRATWRAPTRSLCRRGRRKPSRDSPCASAEPGSCPSTAELAQRIRPSARRGGARGSAPAREPHFNDFKISVKVESRAEDDPRVRLLSEKVPYPLHLGVTEAGTAVLGSIKAAVRHGRAPRRRSGDTLRVSLTADPVGRSRRRSSPQGARVARARPGDDRLPSCGRDNVGVQDGSQRR